MTKVDRDGEQAPRPRFSICLPSRNRFDTVTQSIMSVIEQQYDSFELLVSDNSTVDKGRLADWVYGLGETAAAVRVYETPRDLDMDENWEFIGDKARGDYVLFLADRWKMRKGTLHALSRIIQETNPDLFYWPGQKFGELERQLSETNGSAPIKCEIESADDVLENFLQFRGFENKSVYGQPIPRALNSGFRRELGEQAKAIWGQLFRPISPDYTSATALLLLGKKCIHIKEMMYIPTGNRSNFSDSTIIGLRAYLEKHPDCNNWRGLHMDTVFLTVLTDVERTLDGWIQGNEWKPKMSIENALKCIIWEFHFKEFNGSLHDTKAMRRQVFSFAKENGLSSEAIGRIHQFDRENRHRLVPARKLLRRLGLYEKARKLNNRIRYRHRYELQQDVHRNTDSTNRPLEFSRSANDR